MSEWHNKSGRPLASDTWLEAHHRAKLPERTAFIRQIAERKPNRVVDLGCGPGLWMDLLANALPSDSELVGIDSDPNALMKAAERAKQWCQTSVFQNIDIGEEASAIPEADIFLAFNIFPYVLDPATLLEQLRAKLRPGGSVVVRQYDGALIRLGPMAENDRRTIDTSLMTAVLGSEQFKHYDMDRVFECVQASRYTSKSTDFEIFRRVAPFPPEFCEYFIKTVEWTHTYISEDAKRRLKQWLEGRSDGTEPSYVVEVDLVSWLS